jgi:hypothetical protein
MTFKPRPVRRGQLISPFGVGSMNDFRNDEALMCAGLDNWFRSPPEASLRIQEERLSARLGCQFFVKPPEFSDAEGGPKQMIPHVRFPLWHYCPQPNCFQMRKGTLFGGHPVCENANCLREGRRMIPIRIVAVCENGHIEDFPFREWVRCTCPDEPTAKLQFKAGRSSASLAGIKIDCDTCGKGRTLAGAFDKDALVGVVSCSGAQPWLGREKGTQSCQCKLQTVQRGGSNVYFPAVQSAIYIPPAHLMEREDIKAVLDNPQYWTAISSQLVNGKINPVAAGALAMLANVDKDALIAAAQARLDGAGQLIVAKSEEDFRRQEYDVLCTGAGDPTDELFVERVEGQSYGWLAAFVRRVGLVRKLRETRVLTGFSRLVPKTDRGDPGVQPLAADTNVGWLPAIEIRGEGIFIEFLEDALRTWAVNEPPKKRTAGLIQAYRANRASRKLSDRRIDPRFMMIHTIAHALIKELTFTCGYGSASLRERLYCNLEHPESPMNGILIYTASGDSEGTLGGLVAQARPGQFERLFEDALRRSRWCSNDPVCIESPGQGAGSFNLAACHGCVLLPETSCEEGNRLLDRGLLCGTLAEAATGFFCDVPLG